MVGWSNSADINEETPALYDNFDPFKEWLIDPEHIRLQSPCDYRNFSPESCVHHYSGLEIDQEDQILKSSIDLKMEKVSLLDLSGGLQREEVGLEENGGGNGGEINCMRPGFEALKSDHPLPCKERSSEGEGDDEEGSDESSSDESSSEESSTEESSSDESRSISKSVSSSEDEDDVGMKRQEETAGVFEEGEVRDVREVDEHEIDFLSDEEEGPKGPIMSMHEEKDLPPVPKVDVSLESHHQLLPVGVILSVMMNRVVVEGSARHNPLDEGSVLWVTNARSPLGLVDEIFGPVKNPYYVVRYNTEEEVPAGVEAGISVSFVTEFASKILNQKDLYKKGYDASGDNDEELDNDFDFSDDEKEAEYKRTLRQGKRESNDRKGMKDGIRTDRKRTAVMNPRIQHKHMQKQSIGQPRPTNPVRPQPAAFMGQSSGATNANLLGPSGIPNIPQAMQAVNILGNSSQQLNVGSAAPFRMPEFSQAARPVSLLGNPSQQLITSPQGAPWLSGFSPQLQNMGFQGDLQLQLQSQNLLLNNLVNMVALQQQLQHFTPHQGSTSPWFGALQPSGQNNFAPPPPPPNGFISSPRPQGPGNEQIQGQAPFAPFMQFSAGNSSLLNSNGGNSRSHGRPFHRGGGRFFGRGGRQPNR